MNLYMRLNLNTQAAAVAMDESNKSKKNFWDRLPFGFGQSGTRGEHTVSCLVSTELSRIDRCSCGTFHIRIRNAHFKMSPCEFTNFAAAVGLVSEPFLNEISHRAN